MIEKLLAGTTLAICLLMLLRLALGPRHRMRFDAAVQRATARLRARGLLIWRWPAARRRAAATADEAIRRARQRGRADDGHWDGNVYRPKSFRGERKDH